MEPQPTPASLPLQLLFCQASFTHLQYAQPEMSPASKPVVVTQTWVVLVVDVVTENLKCLGFTRTL